MDSSLGARENAHISVEVEAWGNPSLCRKETSSEEVAAEDEEEEQGIANTQQTPNPAAQGPEETPPFSKHSDEV